MDELWALGIETGLDLGDFGVSPGALPGDVAKLADVLNGGDQKRLRAARAERDGQIAMRDAAIAQLKAAELAAAGGQVPALYAAGPVGGGGVLASIMDTLKGPSPIPHVPMYGLIIGAGLAWYLVTR